VSAVFFRYGAMNATKSMQVLAVRFNYMERGQSVFLWKSATDTREAKPVVKSRIGVEAPVDALLAPEQNLRALFDAQVSEKGKPSCVLVDEAQFLSRDQVVQLCEICDLVDIPVMAFGLRADFKGELFPGSAALLALADRIEEIKTICWCGRKATMNARLLDGKVVKEGPQVQIGGNESYLSLCRRHWREGKTGPVEP
jgi:thymidine kinase